MTNSAQVETHEHVGDHGSAFCGVVINGKRCGLLAAVHQTHERVETSTERQWWCCKADYPNHDPTCLQAAHQVSTGAVLANAVRKAVNAGEVEGDVPCWLCDLVGLTDKREKAMLLMFVAAMHGDNHLKTLCNIHSQAWHRLGKTYKEATK